MLIWLQVTSGQGPEECAWVVQRVVDQILLEAAAQGHIARLLEATTGERADTCKSTLLAVEGTELREFVDSWQGTVQWIGRSPFRPDHKRKNWFVGVNVLSPPEEPVVHRRHFRVESMRSSGPGGQHTNKTQSAVRITHVLTGLSAVAQEERSQHRNRKLALARLLAKLAEQTDNARKSHKTDQWTRHAELERGNPVRVYEGTGFRRKT